MRDVVCAAEGSLLVVVCYFDYRTFWGGVRLYWLLI